MTLFLGISKGNMMSFTTFQKQPAEVFCKKKVFLKILQISQENTCFEEHLQMAAPKHLIFKEQPLVRWKHFNYTKQRTCSHNIDSCPEIRDNTKVVAFVWLLQNKHKIDDFSWWLSKIEPVIGVLKYSSHNISFFFETKVFFERQISY